MTQTALAFLFFSFLFFSFSFLRILSIEEKGKEKRRMSTHVAKNTKNLSIESDFTYCNPLTTLAIQKQPGTPPLFQHDVTTALFSLTLSILSR